MPPLRYESLAGALGRGIGEGLQNIATIRGIQKADEAEARAMRQEKLAQNADIRSQEQLQIAKNADIRSQEKAKMDKAEWDRIHLPTVNIDDAIGSKTADLDEDGKKFVWDKVGLLGIKPGQKVSLKQLEETKSAVFNDPEFTNGIFNHTERSLGKKITEAEMNNDPTKMAEYNQRLQNVRMGNAKYIESQKLALDAAHKARIEQIQQTQANTAAEVAKKTFEHQKAVDDYNAAKLKLDGELATFTKRTKITDEAHKLIHDLADKTTKEELDENNVKITKISYDVPSGHRKAWALNPKLMEEAGYTKPEDVKIDMGKTMGQAAVLLNKNSKVTMEPEAVASNLKKVAKENKIDIKLSDVDEMIKTYPDLKKIRPFFEDKKEETKPEAKASSGKGIGGVFAVDPDWVAAKEGIKSVVKKGINALTPSEAEATTRSRVMSDFRN